MPKQETIRERYETVSDRISQVASSVGRDSRDVQLLVVTKSHPIERIAEVITAGARTLGENYLEEALPKMESFSNIEGLSWHMIGHIQSRKAQAVCANFDMVHSLDRWKLARRLDTYAGELGINLPVLLECNVSGERSKFGWAAWDEKSWSELADELEPIFHLTHLQIRGLMTMPPYFENPEDARCYFVRLHKLRDFLAQRFVFAQLDHLSMGMSADYEVAIQEGATIVRIGTAIMGAR